MTMLKDLFNSLLDKGRKPFDMEFTKFHHISKDGAIFFYKGKKHHEGKRTVREFVSKESLLRQFVCENGMYKKEVLGLYFNDERAKNVFYKIDQFDEEGDVIQTGDMEGDRFIHISEPEYRLIESALRSEDELEEFLLQNIKI